MTLTVCFLVKDKKQRLEHSLDNVRGFADEVVVVDTGSKDGSKQLAEESGAKLVSFAWKDDYAAAKNAGVDAAGSDWILFLKPGETIAEQDKEKIKKKMAVKDVAGYVLQRRHYTNNKDHMRFVKAKGEYDEERGYAGHIFFPVLSLFRKESGIQFEGRVFEDVKESLLRKKKGIKITDVVTHYVDMDEHDPKKQKDRIQKFMKICQKGIKEEPDNPRYVYELARLHKVQGEFPKAIPLFQKAISLGKYKQPEAELGDIYFREGKVVDAMDVYEQCVEKHPSYIPAYLQLGIIYTKRRRYKDAVEMYQTVLERDGQNQVAYQNLSSVLLQTGNIVAAMKVLTVAYKQTGLEKFKKIQDDLQEKVKKNEQIKSLMKDGKKEEAEALLKKEVDLAPQNMLALTNLGSFYYSQKEYQKMVDVIQPVLEGNKSTSNAILNLYTNLAHAYEKMGDKKAAVKTIKQVLKLDPPNLAFFEKRLEELKE